MTDKERNTLSLANLHEDHKSLCDAVHGMLGRLSVLETRVKTIEQASRPEIERLRQELRTAREQIKRAQFVKNGFDLETERLLGNAVQSLPLGM